jgi:hypothetical protein
MDERAYAGGIKNITDSIADIMSLLYTLFVDQTSIMDRNVLSAEEKMEEFFIFNVIKYIIDL